MSTTTTDVKLSIGYQDSTTRTITFSNVRADQMSSIAGRIQTLNANPSAAFRTTFRSANNSPATGIAKAQIIETEEEVIYGED